MYVILVSVEVIMLILSTIICWFYSLVATDSKDGYKYIYNPCDPMTVCNTGGGETDIAVRHLQSKLHVTLY